MLGEATSPFTGSIVGSIPIISWHLWVLPFRSHWLLLDLCDPASSYNQKWMGSPRTGTQNPISRKRLRSPSSFSDSKTARLSFHCISVVQPNKARRLPKESDKEKKLGRIWVKLDVETSWSTVLASEVPESAWNLRRWFDVTSIPKWDFTWPTTQPTNHDTLPGPRIAYSQ